jgi:uncharacterized protein YecT (DUF1311 family)
MTTHGHDAYVRTTRTLERLCRDYGFEYVFGVFSNDMPDHRRMRDEEQHANRQADTASRLVSRATKVMVICLAVLWNGQLLAETDDDPTSKEYSDCLDKAVKGPWADMFECNAEELDRQNARLNDNYKKLMSKLSRDRKKALLKAERAWIKFREANCDYYFDPDGGAAARLDASGCLVTMTAKRAKELEAMLEGL